VPIARHPNVLKAVAHLREADLAMQRVNIRTPISGHVVKRNVQAGHRVQPGAPLMTVVSLDQLWVDANFKEGQLSDIRIGQPVELESDVFGSKVIFHGKVMGLGASTGAAFALLPAQNATGNWIKVVQRVPVRISLDAKELASHPLRVGLSMEVTVDTHDRRGRMLSKPARPTSFKPAPTMPALIHACNARSIRSSAPTHPWCVAEHGHHCGRRFGAPTLARQPTAVGHFGVVVGHLHECAGHLDRQCLDSSHLG